MGNRYIIVARVRGVKGMTFKRAAITQPMSKDAAEKWKPTASLKRAYKYFRVVKYKN